jgi:hydroxypyruvate isomerase
MRLAANVSLLYPDMALEDRLSAAKRDGFAGVEILFPYDIEPEHIAAKLRSLVLQLVLINTPVSDGVGMTGLAAVPGHEDRFRQGFGQALNVARICECPSIHVMAGTPPADLSRNECLETLLANLGFAAEQARTYGIVLTLEALNRYDFPGYFYHQPTEVIEVLQTLEDPAVRLQFDFYHVVKEKLDPVSTLAAVFPYIHHAQIAGAPDRGEPNLNKDNLFSAVRSLYEKGYQGWLGFEYRPRGDTGAGLARRDPLINYLSGRFEPQ